jgi:hypothetical protein
MRANLRSLRVGNKRSLMVISYLYPFRLARGRADGISDDSTAVGRLYADDNNVYNPGNVITG